MLLDTNAFIWWVANDDRLGSKARATIASAANDVYISNLSMFECGIEAKLGKLKIDFDAVDQEISEGKLLELCFDTLVARQFLVNKICYNQIRSTPPLLHRQLPSIWHL